MVVLDPGHGGKNIPPASLYGDKFDPTVGKYLDRFREGAQDFGIWESEWMYELALQIKGHLQNTQSPDGKIKFIRLLKKYGKPPKEIFSLQVYLSRPASYFARYRKIRHDINSDYRLFDHPDILTHELKKGTISRINSYCPELVVTLHLTDSSPDKRGGLASVITPSYETFFLAKRFVEALNKQEIQEIFLKSPYANWFKSFAGYNSWESFLADAWIYFVGYLPNKQGLQRDPQNYRGLRQNWISWNYRESSSLNHKDLQNFEPEGPFWQREMSLAEKWRRENGSEGYGGDNFFAGQQLLRFVRLGLLKNRVDRPKDLPPILPPYISTWAVPTFTNAISAYLELAHLGSPKDRKRLTQNLSVYAESLAVGIYYLFYPFPLNKEKLEDFPQAKGIDFEKYRNLVGGNYFTRVSDCKGM